MDKTKSLHSVLHYIIYIIKSPLLLLLTLTSQNNFHILPSQTFPSIPVCRLLLFCLYYHHLSHLPICHLEFITVSEAAFDILSYWITWSDNSNLDLSYKILAVTLLIALFLLIFLLVTHLTSQEHHLTSQ